MNDDVLKKLIQEADSQPQTTDESPRELAAQVRIVHRQRRRRILVVTASILVVAIGVSWPISPQRHVLHAPQPSPDVASTAPRRRGQGTPTSTAASPSAASAAKGAAVPPKQALAAAMEEIRAREQVVATLLAAERARRLAEQFGSDRPTDDRAPVA